jgi:type IV secretory pathway component VirB8
MDNSVNVHQTGCTPYPCSAAASKLKKSLAIRITIVAIIAVLLIFVLVIPLQKTIVFGVRKASYPHISKVVHSFL